MMLDVDALMAGGLSDWLDSQQAVRIKAKADGRFRTLCGVAAAGVAGFTGLIGLLPFEVAGFLAFALFCGGVVWAQMATKPVERAIKTEMNARIAGALGLSFSIQGEPGMAFAMAREFALMLSYDDGYFEDFWNGILSGVAFTLHEVRLTEERGSGKDRRTVTVFQGVVMSAEYGRTFFGTVLIERSCGWSGLFGSDSVTRGGLELEKMRMVDPRIDDSFALWTTDPVEGRMIVHPAYAERLLDLETRFAGQNLRALFHQGQIVIAIETGALFESGSLDADRDRALMDETIGQLMSLVAVANAMNEGPRRGVNSPGSAA